MMTRRVVVRALFIFILSFGGGPLARADDDDLSVTVKPWPDPTIERFDPEEKPDDIPKDEDGRAVAEVRVSEPAFQTSADSSGKITITTVGAVTVDARSTIKVPENAGEEPTRAEKDLLEHEQGHNTLAKKEYDARAEEKAKAAFRGFKGMMFQGEGATLQDKLADAKAKAEAEIKRRALRAGNSILDQIDAANMKFDRLTDHGTGTGDGKEKDADGKIKPVTTEVGISMVMKERTRAPDAGSTGALPNTDMSFVEAPGVPVSTDPMADLISFGGLFPLTTAYDPDDPILTNGMLQIDPMRLIGLNDDGTALLSDSTVRIFEGTEGPPLLDAFLLELAFMPSTRDGFDFMIRGFLDIPPPFAGGLDPDFDSEFLVGMLRASEAGAMTTFWLFTSSALVDDAGNLLRLDGGIEGTAVLAKAVPEPPTAWLYSLGVVLALWLVAGRPGPGGVRSSRRSVLSMYSTR